METLAEILAQPIPASRALVLELISYIDLTTLSDADSNESVLKLVEKANVGFKGIHPAAICAYSQFAAIVRKNLKPNMQTVAVGTGFPSGLTATEEKVQHAETILNSGADELDIVLNHTDFSEQNYSKINTEISLIKSTLGNKHLKVILETGELKTLENINKASIIACNAGADFIKTSTGKTTTGSTPEAVYQMCLVIAEHYKKTGRAVGIKPSGGIRTFEEAALLHLIIHKTLGKAWLTPALFRIGASSLYDNLIQKYKRLDSYRDVIQHKEIQTDWITIAVAAAKEASAAMLEIYNSGFEVEIKADRSPVTIADKKSGKIISSHLAKTGIQIMSEEEEAAAFIERQKQALIWIVDPLDGTKEFIAKNGEFCICIALVKNGKPIFGLIAAPITQTILLGGNEMGAYYFDYDTVDYLNDAYKVPQLKLNAKKTVAHSRSHFSTKGQAFIDSITEKYGKPAYIKKGSALKFIDLTLGKADFYPRLAPTMEWDIAAGQAIYESVGGEVLDFTNFEPLEYNKENLYNPFFIAKNKELNI